MSLNERFGRNNAGVRTVSIPDKPDVQMLQKLLGELSMATMGTQCDVSWQSGDDTYTLSLNHSRQTTRASWKLSRGKGTQSLTVWAYATNDVSIVHKSVSDLLNKNMTQSQIRMPSASDPDVVSQERRAVNINGNLSGKLRKLFIGTQEDLMAGTNSALLPGGRTPARSIVEYVDLTPGRQLLQQLFVGQFGIFSYATFLFFLEREYYTAMESHGPLTLIVFKAIRTTVATTKDLLPNPVLYEIAKRIKNTQRKTDILAEYDQNTFAVLLPDTDAVGGKSFVRRVERVLFKTALMEDLGETSIKFAFGVSSLGNHSQTLPTFLLFAKKSLEKAQKLGTDIFSDNDILAERNFKAQEYIGKPIDLSPVKQLMSEMISGGIFTYPAFLTFLEHAYYRSTRKKRDLLIMLLKIRVYEETYDVDANQLPPAAFYEVIRRVESLLGKRDIFAHYSHGNFVIMRTNTSVIQMLSFTKKLTQLLISEEWLTPECSSSSLRIRTQVCTIRVHDTAPNLFGFVAVN